MNRDDDFNRTLQTWLLREAPPQAPDRVLESALQRVSAQPQRRSWQQRLVGETLMATLLRAAAVTAVVAIAVLVGFQLNNLIPDVGESSSSPTITEPSPSATGSPRVGCVNPPTDITTLIDLQSTGPLDPAGDPVACYGNAALTFDATWYGGGVADCPAAPEPAWLACSAYSLQLPGDRNKLSRVQLWVAVHPSVSLSFSEPFAQVRVTGHFDDPAAQTCRETQLGGGAETLTPVAETIEQCRRAFVITQVVPLETSPVSMPSLSPAIGCLDSPPDVAVLSVKTDPVACFGNAPLTFDAYSVPGVADCPVIIEPVWLSCLGSSLRLVGGVGAQLFVAIGFDSDTSWGEYLNMDVRVTGHYDDPAAQTCEVCRSTFVVTQVVPL